MHHKLVQLAFTLGVSALISACSGGSDSDESSGEFRNFVPTVRALSGGGSLSLSTAPGAIGCGLAQSFDAVPGLAADQIFLRFFNFSRFSEGTSAIIASGCQGDGSDIPADCAIYRQWNDTGDLQAVVYATGGAVTVSRPFQDSASVAIDLVFPEGVTFSDSFTLDDSSDCLQ